MIRGQREPTELAALAEQHGLRNSTARPTLPTYLRQVWERRQFIWVYANARTTTQYSGSRLGQVWQIITPLLQAGIYYLVFGLLLDLSRNVENYPAFLITGVFIFTFLQRSLTNGAKAVSNSLQLIRAVHFPRAVLPLSFVLVEFKQLIISLTALFVIILVTGEPLTVKWLLVVFAVVLTTLFNAGLGMFMARIGAASADVNQLLPFMIRVWFYLSGVFFTIDRWLPNLPEVFHPILQLNPGAVFLDLYRGILIASHEPMDLPYGLSIWVVASAWSFFLLIGGFLFFWQREERYGRG